MKRFLDDIPSIPEVPSIEPLNLGITTRVLAKRLERDRSRIVELKRNPRERDVDRHRRMSSKFLEGASIPNSIIQSEMQKIESIHTKEIDKKLQEREEFVEKLMKRLQPQKKVLHSIYDENVDREALNKIKKELRRRSLLPLNQENEAEKKSLSIASTIKSTTKSIKDPWEELKEKRRISRRTSILAPLNGEKRPTYESIRKAIQNSKIIQQLLDADNIEQQKLKEIQESSKPLATIEVEESDKVSLPGSPTEKQRSAKRDISSPKVKEKKVLTKKRSTTKSDKSLTNSLSEKPSKHKGSVSELKKSVKRSNNLKTLKEDLQRSSISNTALQKRHAT